MHLFSNFYYSTARLQHNISANPRVSIGLTSVANLAILSLDLESFLGFLVTKFVPSS